MRKSRYLILLLVLLFSLVMAGLALAQENKPQATPIEADSVAQAKAPASILSTSYVYTNTTPVAIPDNNCTTGYVTSTITVPDSFMIGDLNVGLWATHTYRSDMDLLLVHPDGTILNLLLDPDTGGDHPNALLDGRSPHLATPDTKNPVAPPPYWARRGCPGWTPRPSPSPVPTPIRWSWPRSP
mgnify:CR=1 FL=1